MAKEKTTWKAVLEILYTPQKPFKEDSFQIHFILLH